MKYLASVLWTRSMEAPDIFRLFSYLDSLMYMGYRSVFLLGLSLTFFKKHIFVGSFWDLSLIGSLSASYYSLCFFREFCCFWHSLKNILESMSWFYWKYSLYFCFLCFFSFLLEVFKKRKKLDFCNYGYEKSQWNITNFIEVNIKILNWFSQTLNKHFGVEIAWEGKYLWNLEMRLL